MLDKFLRRCLIACGQMMFENISELYDNYIKYLKGQPYQFLHSTVQLENWAQNKAIGFDDQMLMKNWQKMDHEFALETGDIMSSQTTKVQSQKPNQDNTDKFNHSNLLNAMNSCCNHDDLDAIFFAHKYNDHNLRQMDIKE